MAKEFHTKIVRAFVLPVFGKPEKTRKPRKLQKCWKSVKSMKSQRFAMICGVPAAFAARTGAPLVSLGGPRFFVG